MPLRDGDQGLEVLMLRRSPRGAFGGVWVFPGGQVDPVDRAASQQDSDPESEIAAARRAAVREAREEAGIELDPSSLVVHSFWFPPPEVPRRFSTWFFLAPAEGAEQVVVDEVEIHEHRWLTPAATIRMRQEGQIELAPPTFTTLHWLASQPGAAAALEAARRTTPARFETHLVSWNGVGACLWEGDAGYADGDLDRPGPRRRLLMEAAGWRLELSP